MPTDQSTKKRHETIDGIGKPDGEDDLKITTAEEWNTPAHIPREVGIVVTLPSGRNVRVRRTMDMMTLLQSGRLPNPLAQIVNDMITTGDGDLQKALRETEDPEAVRQLFDLMNQTMAKTFVEPQVSSPPPRERDEDWDAYMKRIDLPEREADESEEDFQKRYFRDGWHRKGTVSVFDIEMPDKMYVFAVAQGAASDLARFRDESESVVGAVQPSKRVVKPTKRTGGAKSKG
jgi:hypothetical protein